MKSKSIALVLLSFALGVLSKVPKWHRPFERRFNALEEKVNDESLEFRNELLSVLQKIEDVKSNMSDTSEGMICDKHDVDNKVGVGAGSSGAIAEILTTGFRVEKEYVRRSLHEVEQSVVASGADLSQRLQNVKKGLRADIISTKRALDKELAYHFKIMNEKENVLETILQRLDKIENSLNDSIASIQGYVEDETASCRKEIEEMEERVNRRLDVMGELLTSPQEPDIKQQRCKSWHYHSGSCYYISNESVTWENARDRCLSLSGHLAEVDNAEEAAFLRNLAHENGAPINAWGTWLGATDVTDEGVWVWHYTGKKVGDVFDDWPWNEPNGGTSENCLHLYEELNYVWNDTPCDFLNNFICER